MLVLMLLLPALVSPDESHSSDRERRRRRRTLAGSFLVGSAALLSKASEGGAKTVEAEGPRTRADCSGFVKGPPLFVLVRKRRQ